MARGDGRVAESREKIRDPEISRVGASPTFKTIIILLSSQLRFRAFGTSKGVLGRVIILTPVGVTLRAT